MSDLLGLCKRTCEGGVEIGRGPCPECGNTAEQSCGRRLPDPRTARIAELEAALTAERERAERAEALLKKVQGAALRGMDAATEHGRGLVEQAAKLSAHSNPDALDSERAANARLTEQLEKAEAELAAERERVGRAEAEVERLRAEKDAVKIAAWDKSSEQLREVVRLTQLLANVFDNLNDLPISDEWARLTCDRISAALGGE